jgi:hypothetical protein
MPLIPKAKKLVWTSHSESKMRQYRLSESRVRRVIHSPLRIEEGIAEDTIAMMQPASVKRSEKGKPVEWTQEIWVMISETPKERRVVSTWRYPAMTKPGQELPPEVIRELRQLAQ